MNVMFEKQGTLEAQPPQKPGTRNARVQCASSSALPTQRSNLRIRTPRQLETLVLRVGRTQSEVAIFGSHRGDIAQMFRIRTGPQGYPEREVVEVVIWNEDKHNQPGIQTPGVFVVKGQLGDLAGTAPPECRGRHVQVRQLPCGHLLQPDVELLRNSHLPRLNEGIADHGDVTTLRGPLRARRFAVQEPQTVGAGNGPEVKAVRPADLRIGTQQNAHAGNEDRWPVN